MLRVRLQLDFITLCFHLVITITTTSVGPLTRTVSDGYAGSVIWPPYRPVGPSETNLELVMSIFEFTVRWHEVLSLTCKLKGLASISNRQRTPSRNTLSMAKFCWKLVWTRQ